MEIKIVGQALDNRTNTHVFYVQTSIRDYLTLVGDNFDQFEIQRNRQDFPAYIRMKEDIIAGGLLPPLTLSVKRQYVNEVLTVVTNYNELTRILSRPDQVDILDGLQRTYILKEISNQNLIKSESKLLLEFWVEPELKHLIYRLIVLNAGRKQMTLKHQLELLFMNVVDLLKKDIDDLEIYKEVDETIRKKPKQFAFDRIVTSYQAFVTGRSEISKENLIAQELSEQNVFLSSEEALNQKFSDFSFYLNFYAKIDSLTFTIYSNNDTKYKNWFAQETVMNCFFAAIGDYNSIDGKKQRTDKAIRRLISTLETNNETDPLGLTDFTLITSGLNSRKVNVGIKTRGMLKIGFKEFFREEGEKALKKCWDTEDK